LLQKQRTDSVGSEAVLVRGYIQKVHDTLNKIFKTIKPLIYERNSHN
jgi:hypothetical protein